jgi:hypothetical protein
VELLRAQLEDLRADRDAWRDQARRSDYMASAALDRTRELEGRLRELEAPSEQQQASSSPPSVLRGSIEEGGKQAARLLVGGIAALVIGVPSAVGSLISYFNDAPTLTILGATTAFFGILTGLVGIYFGIRASAVAAEGAQRIASEANTTAEQAAREVQREGTQAGEPTSGA